MSDDGRDDDTTSETPSAEAPEQKTPVYRDVRIAGLPAQLPDRLQCVLGFFQTSDRFHLVHPDDFTQSYGLLVRIFLMMQAQEKRQAMLQSGLIQTATPQDLKRFKREQ